MEQHRAAAGEEPLDERRAVGGRRPGREGAAEPGLDLDRRPPAGVVKEAGRPTLDQSVDPPGTGELLEHGRQVTVAGRVVDDSERRLRPAHPLDHRPRRVPSSTASAARSRPEITRTTSSSNTTRSDAASVPRTSP